jgi:probable F420-dependent oxidoreductase
VQFWQSLIYAPVEEHLDLARAAEEAGFDGVAVPDHVALPERMRSRYPYADVELDPMGPYPDCFVSIAAMAAVTTRLRFITYVYVLPMRNPFVVAKAAGTAAILSSHRVVLGVGVGWLREEFELLGHDFGSRGGRTDEMLAVMHDLWVQGRTEHRGRHLDIPPTCMAPVPGRALPVWIGGHSDVALARAARHDGWIGLNFGLDELTGHLDRLRRARSEHRPATASGAAVPERFDVVVAPEEPIDGALCERLAAIGVTGVVTPILARLGARTPRERLDALRRFGDRVVRPHRDRNEPSSSA